MMRPRYRTALFLLPAGAWFFAMLVLPLVVVFVFSFGERGPAGGYVPAFTFDNFLNLGSRWAAFIGSPSMNLLQGQVARDGSFAGDGVSFPMPVELEHGRKITYGIRPEHLQISSSGWTVQIDTIEMLGAERLVSGHMGSEPLIVRMDESLPCPALGANIHVSPRPERLHWFDSQTGQRLADAA